MGLLVLTAGTVVEVGAVVETATVVVGAADVVAVSTSGSRQPGRAIRRMMRRKVLGLM